MSSDATDVIRFITHLAPPCSEKGQKEQPVLKTNGLKYQIIICFDFKLAEMFRKYLKTICECQNLHRHRL